MFFHLSSWNTEEEVILTQLLTGLMTSDNHIFIPFLVT